MTKTDTNNCRLKFKFLDETDAERADFIRRTRTICIYADERPGIYSKSLAKVKLTTSNGRVIEDVFCVDAKGSKKGCIIGHAAHFVGFKNGETVTLDIDVASARDCVHWLSENDDPERKAFSHILKNTLDASDETREISALAQKTLETTKENLKKAQELSEIAHAEKESARRDRKVATVFGVVGFALGAILDIGMLEDKFGIFVPKEIILGLFAVSLLALLLARWFSARKRRKNRLYAINR